MIQEYEQIEVVKRHKKTCDICHTEIKRDLMCSIARCEICKIDLCEKCIGYEESDRCSGDYRMVYCESCWNIGKPIREKVEELSKQIESLYDEWHFLCGKK